jgi:hypothetical protein
MKHPNKKEEKKNKNFEGPHPACRAENRIIVFGGDRVSLLSSLFIILCLSLSCTANDAAVQREKE